MMKRPLGECTRNLTSPGRGILYRLLKGNPFDQSRSTYATAKSHPRIQVQGTIPYGGKGVAVGQSAFVHRTFSEQDVHTFGQLIGDQNPLHTHLKKADIPAELRDHHLLQWKQSTPSLSPSSSDAITNNHHPSWETRPLVHGMLSASLFSCIFGTLVPGAVYLRQNLSFVQPLYADTSVVGRCTIVKIRDWSRRRSKGGVVLTCETTVSPAVISPTQQQNDNARGTGSVKAAAITETGDSPDAQCFVQGEADVWLPLGTPLLHPHQQQKRDS